MTNEELDEAMIKSGLVFGHSFGRSNMVSFYKEIERRTIEKCAQACESFVLRTKTREEAKSQSQGNATAHDIADALRGLK